MPVNQNMDTNQIENGIPFCNILEGLCVMCQRVQVKSQLLHKLLEEETLTEIQKQEVLSQIKILLERIQKNLDNFKGTFEKGLEQYDKQHQPPDVKQVKRITGLSLIKTLDEDSADEAELDLTCSIVSHIKGSRLNNITTISEQSKECDSSTVKAIKIIESSDEDEMEVKSFDAICSPGPTETNACHQISSTQLSENLKIEKNFNILQEYEKQEIENTDLLQILDDANLDPTKTYNADLLKLLKVEYNSNAEEALRYLEEEMIHDGSDSSLVESLDSNRIKEVLDISDRELTESQSEESSSDHECNESVKFEKDLVLELPKLDLMKEHEINRLCNIHNISIKKSIYVKNLLRCHQKANAKKLLSSSSSSNNSSDDETPDDLTSNDGNAMIEPPRKTSSPSASELENDQDHHLDTNSLKEKPDFANLCLNSSASNSSDESADEKNKSSSTNKLKRKRILSSSSESGPTKKSKAEWQKDPLLQRRLWVSSESENEDKEETNVDVKQNEGSSSDENLKRSSKKNNSKLNKSIYQLTDTEDENDEQKEQEEQKGSDTPSIKSGSDSDSSDSIEFYDGDFFQIIKSESDSDVEIISENSVQSRKQIRRILEDTELTQETQQAKAQEMQRIERLEALNKTKTSISSQTNGLILDVNPTTKQPIIIVDENISQKLKPHQSEGVKFMWESCYESVEAIRSGNDGSGCILAHCMGLGKTLQVVALINTLFNYEELTKAKHALVVCPLSTVLNWRNEFHLAFNLMDTKPNYEVFLCLQENLRNKYNIIKNWMNQKGVLIVNYETYVQFTGGRSKKLKPEEQQEMTEALVNPGPQLVICDEGHLIKNGNALRSKALLSIKTARRIILTGTPLQNNLKEYYYMVDFVKPKLLGTVKEYSNRFVNPIMNGHFHDSTQQDINLMKKRTHVLNKLLKKTIHRRESTLLKTYLPEILDYTLFVQLSETQIDLYKKFLNLAVNKGFGVIDTKGFLRDFRVLKYICFHPYTLYLQKNLPKTIKKRTVTDEDILEDIAVNDLPSHWWSHLKACDLAENLHYGTKVDVIMSIIDEAEQLGDKTLFFTDSLLELDCIEHFLKTIGTPNRRYWVRNQNYFRMDGTVSAHDRDQLCNRFNSNDDKRVTLFLISHKVGGLGLNLVAANRVILAGCNFNPSHDTQSIYRTYRFGQTKKCYVYRLVTMGTMEQKVYQRSVVKLSVASTVVDKFHIERHIARGDFFETMYTYDFESYTKSRPVPKLPSDKLLAELLQKTNNIFEYNNYQSLLENRPEEELNDEEKKSAWDEYNNEGNTPNQPLTPQQIIVQQGNAFFNRSNGLADMPLLSASNPQQLMNQARMTKLQAMIDNHIVRLLGNKKNQENSTMQNSTTIGNSDFRNLVEGQLQTSTSFNLQQYFPPNPTTSIQHNQSDNNYLNAPPIPVSFPVVQNNQQPNTTSNTYNNHTVLPNTSSYHPLNNYTTAPPSTSSNAQSHSSAASASAHNNWSGATQNRPSGTTYRGQNQSSTVQHRHSGGLYNLSSTAQNLPSATSSNSVNRPPSTTSNILNQPPGTKSNTSTRPPATLPITPVQPTGTSTSFNVPNRSAGISSTAQNRLPAISSNSANRRPSATSNTLNQPPGTTANTSNRPSATLPSTSVQPTGTSTSFNVPNRSAGISSTAQNQPPTTSSNLANRRPSITSNTLNQPPATASKTLNRPPATLPSTSVQPTGTSTSFNVPNRGAGISSTAQNQPPTTSSNLANRRPSITSNTLNQPPGTASKTLNRPPATLPSTSVQPTGTSTSFNVPNRGAGISSTAQNRPLATSSNSANRRPSTTSNTLNQPPGTTSNTSNRPPATLPSTSVQSTGTSTSFNVPNRGAGTSSAAQNRPPATSSNSANRRPSTTSNTLNQTPSTTSNTSNRPPVTLPSTSVKPTGTSSGGQNRTPATKSSKQKRTSGTSNTGDRPRGQNQHPGTKSNEVERKASSRSEIQLPHKGSDPKTKPSNTSSRAENQLPRKPSGFITLSSTQNQVPGTSSNTKSGSSSTAAKEDKLYHGVPSGGRNHLPGRSSNAQNLPSGTSRTKSRSSSSSSCEEKRHSRTSSSGQNQPLVVASTGQTRPPGSFSSAQNGPSSAQNRPPSTSSSAQNRPPSASSSAKSRSSDLSSVEQNCPSVRSSNSSDRLPDTLPSREKHGMSSGGQHRPHGTSYSAQNRPSGTISSVQNRAAGTSYDVSNQLSGISFNVPNQPTGISSSPQNLLHTTQDNRYSNISTGVQIKNLPSTSSNVQNYLHSFQNCLLVPNTPSTPPNYQPPNTSPNVQNNQSNFSYPITSNIPSTYSNPENFPSTSSNSQNRVRFTLGNTPINLNAQKYRSGTIKYPLDTNRSHLPPGLFNNNLYYRHSVNTPRSVVNSNPLQINSAVNNIEPKNIPSKTTQIINLDSDDTK